MTWSTGISHLPLSDYPCSIPRACVVDSLLAHHASTQLKEQHVDNGGDELCHLVTDHDDIIFIILHLAAVQYCLRAHCPSQCRYEATFLALWQLIHRHQTWKLRGKRLRHPNSRTLQALGHKVIVNAGFVSSVTDLSKIAQLV